jgi:hypothetical protein
MTLEDLFNQPPEPELIPICQCGHSKAQHGPKTADGFYREEACLLCPSLACDEFEFQSVVVLKREAG